MHVLYLLTFFLCSLLHSSSGIPVDGGAYSTASKRSTNTVATDNQPELPRYIQDLYNNFSKELMPKNHFNAEKYNTIRSFENIAGKGDFCD